ncbi:LOW QUALITY PROTEIN: ubiquitin carboxyl-terminal hydrolase 25-like [Brienomyrus brachyistius]|uniref:LOW QUALITY PROTEIN: ubiquitin carboxyl-terminal hydrolase 25-like n=1 Tax=Brienomyrus brachyistius TaxID=42636 RepID=UPI0020B45B00|nr:LOW QUALITY PROTEIN: ubiquitin carboxyl-terminal hydrolase 25-like [Brienomyrus brachyistius]
MTVEQNVLQQHSQKHQQSLLNQLKEVTGTTDVRLLQQALQFCNGDLAGAVAFLTERSAKVPEHDEDASYQPAQIGNDGHINVGSQADTNVIDLTGDDKDDLQKAIALSLEESSRTLRETGITDEEQAISRVLEASIAENKASLQQTGEQVWSDSPNPYERKRCENCPVGLKNVGNTCWFSAVIQSLFHLLEFQKLVLQYTPPACAHDLPRNQKEHRNLPFMQELRKLFSLMIGSERKYVDPSHAVEILKEAFKSSDSQQQDVSEFTHKLLDWLEDAFQMKAEEDREGEQPKNPMVELFYGRFLAVGVHEGKKFENAEMFGQYPLQVNGFNNLHECLEAAMIEGEIESLHSENSAKSGQEHWFTELPPVLTLELSRFEFNQALGRPEKIHNKLEFPPLLYVDRYMDKNKEVTRMKREEIRRLKEHLTLLQQRLERYLSYGSGPKRCPLADVLEYTMEFASSKPACSLLLENTDASGAPPGGAAAPLQPTPSVTELDPAVGCQAPVNALPSQQRAPVHKPFTQSRLPPDEPAHPAPRHISEEELSVLESCLQRWRNEVEGDIHDLQRSIAKIQRTTELMYSEKTMTQVPYRLHAVLVHEGQANAGHYWAYIYSSRHRCWMKYNDISVTESSWEELMRDSFGGYRNTSAYCLMYINDKKPFLIEEDSDEVMDQPLTGLDKLPADLRAYVKEDNQLFEKELRQWDTLQEKRKARAVVPASMMGPSWPRNLESSPSAAPQQYMEQPSSLYTCEHLKADTERAISQAAAEQHDSGPEAVLNALTGERVPSYPQPEALAVLALKMAASLTFAPQPLVEDPTPRLVVELPKVPVSSDQFQVKRQCGALIPIPDVLSKQGAVDRPIQEVVIRSLPVAKGYTPAPFTTQPVIDRPVSQSSTDELIAVGSTGPPSGVQLVVEMPAVLPPDSQPTIEVSAAPSSDFQPTVELSTPSPFQSQPMIPVSTALSPNAQPAVEMSAVPPTNAQPVPEVSTSPPPDTQPVVEVSSVLPPDSQPMVEVPTVPPPDSQPMVEVQATPPIEAQLTVEISAALPLNAQPTVAVSTLPPTLVDGSIIPPPTKVIGSRHLLPDSDPVVEGTTGLPEQRWVKVATHHKGACVSRLPAGGYDDEDILTPSMQGIILAVGRARSVYEKYGPEAAFFKAIKAEYARLLHLAWEGTQPEIDLRIQYVMVYLIQNQAPKKILERTLLTQFTDPSLGYDERCKNIMKVARAKLDLIRPDEVNMEQYEIWHQEYRNFRETTIFLMIGLELVQKRSYVEALPYLIYSYQCNKALLSKGPYRGHDAELIAHHRRACLLKLNEQAAALFEYGEEPEVSDGLNVMKQLVVPCLPLLLTDEGKEKDVAAVEDIRNRWCSYLGREMDPKLQETLTDFLPKLLDCSTEMKSFSEPPRLPSWSTPELCARFSHVMTSLRRTPADGR